MREIVPSVRYPGQACGSSRHARYSRSTMARPLVYNASLVRRDDLTPDLAVFHVRHDTPWGRPGHPAFEAGQYIVIGLNNEDEPALGSVRRSMSIASAPEQLEAVELYIRRVVEPTSDNPLTALLWRQSVGARVHLTRRATGKLTVAATVGTDDPRLLVMVAAGTGLAPFVSIVRGRVLRDPGADLSRIAILHGASYPGDLGYRQELERYARVHGLRYLPTVSRPREAPEWRGATGRVEEHLRAERLGALEAFLDLAPGELTPARVAVMVCGLEGTIGAVLRRTLARGFVPEQRRMRRALGIPSELPPSLWWEQYDAEPIIDTSDAALVAELRALVEQAY